MNCFAGIVSVTSSGVAGQSLPVSTKMFVNGAPFRRTLRNSVARLRSDRARIVRETCDAAGARPVNANSRGEPEPMAPRLPELRLRVGVMQ